ncbi:hypothetical protein E2C01_062840 [Portunus trituberculatus]|uniref:Uncharacterized protein n=1 Tax=Portunus trituberculatus TaxID=210409 RepID=A0A5B7HF61_PORTR|nr:hypothetical protein [Portunus trituberculatus]
MNGDQRGNTDGEVKVKARKVSSKSTAAGVLSCEWREAGRGRQARVGRGEVTGIQSACIEYLRETGNGWLGIVLIAPVRLTRATAAHCSLLRPSR